MTECRRVHESAHCCRICQLDTKPNERRTSGPEKAMCGSTLQVAGWGPYLVASTAPAQRSERRRLSDCRFLHVPCGTVGGLRFNRVIVTVNPLRLRSSPLSTPVTALPPTGAPSRASVSEVLLTGSPIVIPEPARFTP